MTEASTTLQNEIEISKLRITSEDEYLNRYVKENGDSVEKSPAYLLLKGEASVLKHWFTTRNLDWLKRAKEIFDLYFDIKKNGQKEPIKIYNDMRINTGHKRAAVMLFMGCKKIKYEIVPDDYKL